LRFLEKAWSVARQEVEVVHPRGGGSFEDVAPYEVVLLVDEELPGIGLVEGVVAWKV
jgi:hypothetical protein